MTFRRKLFISFLVLAFLPTSAFIFLSYHLATEGADLLVARGVSRSLDAADSLAVWTLNQEQQKLTNDLISLEICSSSDSAKLSLVSSNFDFAKIITSSGESQVAGDWPDNLDQPEYDSTEAVMSGRYVSEGRLLIWCCVVCDSVSVITGRYLPPEYYNLANEIFEGRTNYSSLSRALLPGGKNLLLKLSIALALAFLVLALLAAQMLSYGMTAPLAKLTEATKRISRGDLKFRIPERRRDEIGTLIDDFNRMSDKLEHTTEELLTAEREMAWQDTARTISHEIKNLLTPVNLTLFRVRQGITESPQPDDKLVRSISALSGEVDAIAEMAKQFALFAHPPKLAYTDVKLREIIAEVVALYADTEGSFEIATEVEPSELSVCADRDLLRRVLNNLVKNSLEATHYQGRVVVVASDKVDHALLCASDDGPGADLAEDLTRPYLTTRKGGTGLGLTIVKKVCQSHNWQLSFENLRPGFTVRIVIPK